jgi:hypothetical protein
MSGFSAQRQHDAASEEKTMARRPRRNHSPAFKAQVAVAAIKGEKTLIGWCHVWTAPFVQGLI